MEWYPHFFRANSNVYSGTHGARLYEENETRQLEVKTAAVIQKRKEVGIDKKFNLAISPNPFNSNTVIKYTIPSESRNYTIDLAIFNIRGELIKQIVKEKQVPENYSVQWDATTVEDKNVSTGIYLVRLMIGKYQVIRKVILIR